MKIYWLISLALFSLSLWPAMAYWEWLKFHGLHSATALFLLLSFICFLIMLLTTSEISREQRAKKFFHGLFFSHFWIIAVFGFIYGLRQGVRFVFVNYMPQPLREADEVAFFGLFVVLFFLGISLLPSLRKRTRDQSRQRKKLP